MEKYYHIGEGKVVIPDIIKAKSYHFGPAFEPGYLASLIFYGECKPYLPVGWLPDCEEELQVLRKDKWIKCEMEELEGVKRSGLDWRIIVTPIQPQESTCQNCDGENPVWSADNELWNKVMDKREEIVCPTCFVKSANEKGVEMFGIKPQENKSGALLFDNPTLKWEGDQDAYWWEIGRMIMKGYDDCKTESDMTELLKSKYRIFSL